MKINKIIQTSFFVFVAIISQSCGNQNKTFDAKKLNGTWTFSGISCSADNEPVPAILSGYSTQIIIRDSKARESIFSPYCNINISDVRFVQIKDNIFDEIVGGATCNPNPCSLPFTIAIAGVRVSDKVECPSTYPSTVSNIRYDVSDDIWSRSLKISPEVECSFRYKKTQ